MIPQLSVKALPLTSHQLGDRILKLANDVVRQVHLRNLFLFLCNLSHQTLALEPDLSFVCLLLSPFAVIGLNFEKVWHFERFFSSCE